MPRPSPRPSVKKIASSCLIAPHDLLLTDRRTDGHVQCGNSRSGIVVGHGISKQQPLIQSIKKRSRAAFGAAKSTDKKREEKPLKVPELLHKKLVFKGIL